MKASFKIWGILCVTLGISAHSMSQDIAPGGVRNPLVWQCAQATPAGTFWVDRRTHERKTSQTRAEAKLNFNTTVSFDGQGFCQNLDKPIGEATVFVVYRKASLSSESIVWCAGNMDTSMWVLTTNHMADLKQGYYIPLQMQEHPAQYCYLHGSHKGEGSTAIDLLCLSITLSNPPLPFAAFDGAIAEWIVYGRVLSAAERNRVESYLAIKYGISLSGETSPYYVSAQGSTLWNGYSERDHRFRITGIGKDETSGLLQFRSSSSYEPGTLTIGMADTSEIIPDGSFLLWGDNNEDMTSWEPVAYNSITSLHRQWRIHATNWPSKVNTRLTFDRSSLPPLERPNSTIYLMIDRSGTGQYAPGHTDFVPGHADSGQFIFDDITWDTDHSGSDLFQLVSAHESAFYITVQQPSCEPPSHGTITCKVLRPASSITYACVTPDGSVITMTSGAGAICEMPATLTGEYQITITDANGLSSKEAFFIDHSDGPAVCLENQYYLTPKKELVLASGCLRTDVMTTWYFESQFVQHGDQLTVSTPGRYTVEAERNGCISRKSIQVLQALDNAFVACTLYPNPISAESPLHLEVALRDPSPLTLDITSSSGSRIFSRFLGTESSFVFDEHMTLAPGVYYCNLHAGEHYHSISFIVQ